jgi:hypothetical protein
VNLTLTPAAAAELRALAREVGIAPAELVARMTALTRALRWLTWLGSPLCPDPDVEVRGG